MTKPRIAITLGDPAGIGPEIVNRAVNSLKVKRVCSPVIFGDKQTIEKYFKNNKSSDFIISSEIKKEIKLGKPSKESGEAAVKAIEKGVEYCLQGKSKALITAPVSKESFKFAGIKYPGHTEMIAALTKSKDIAMLMSCGNINSVMVTRHMPLSEVHLNIKSKDIINTVKVAVRFLEKSSKKKVDIVVCGLNPHAGDNSILGKEEKKYIAPACEKLKKAGFKVCGPLPADSAWLKTKNGEFDLICGMYHDQIMIALKCIDANKIVNITAGLPFIRTSPGHGTAFDIAGKNIANADAMTEAILYAAKRI